MSRVSVYCHVQSLYLEQADCDARTFPAMCTAVCQLHHYCMLFVTMQVYTIAPGISVRKSSCALLCCTMSGLILGSACLEVLFLELIVSDRLTDIV